MEQHIVTITTRIENQDEFNAQCNLINKLIIELNEQVKKLQDVQVKVIVE